MYAVFCEPIESQWITWQVLEIPPLWQTVGNRAKHVGNSCRREGIALARDVNFGIWIKRHVETRPGTKFKSVSRESIRHI